MIDQLRFASFGRPRETIEGCLTKLRDLEATTSNKIGHRRYVNFVEAVHKFGSSRPRPIDAETADHLLKLFEDVPDSEQTCNSLYFRAAMLFRSNRLPESIPAMNKALRALGGTSPLMTTRIMYGKLIGDMMTTIDAKNLQKKNRRRLSWRGSKYSSANLPITGPLESHTLTSWLIFTEMTMLSSNWQWQSMAEELPSKTLSKQYNTTCRCLLSAVSRLAPSLFPNTTTWEDALRAELTKRREARRTRAQSGVNAKAAVSPKT